ncbi:EI24 domain-containing protein [Haloactinospora alba]|uniref:EI24 domain-containing protein n=1 Tax=Haloactinospora alba TaxID=405555 RepID=UPI00374351F1
MTPIRDTISGAGDLLRGAGIVLRRPKLFLLGMLPPLVTSFLFVAALVALLLSVSDLVTWLTPFAAGWDPAWSAMLRVALGIAVVAGAVFVMVVAFSGVTLALGAPLYDKIAEEVDDELGNAPQESDEGVVGSVLRSVRQSLVLVLISAVVAVALFAGGFVPVLGQTVIPVVSVLFGSWLLGAELVGAAFDRRGLLRLRDRQRHMRGRRMRVLGFAVPTYLMLAVPFLAIVVFPAASAGGTVLARNLVPQPQQQQPVPPQPPQQGAPPPPPPGHWR